MMLSDDLNLRVNQIRKIALWLSKGWLNRVTFKIAPTEHKLPDEVE
ncbi:hypothetical protein [Vibrio sp. EJY3]|nr:hypothetical protein [Vibrio sp. EJY3]